jgi:hypothetical protein
LYTDGNTENRDTNLAEILQMIEETLVDAWILGVEEFKNRKSLSAIQYLPYNFGIYINRNLLSIGITGIVKMFINNNITCFKC